MTRCRQESYGAKDDFRLPDPPYESGLQDGALRKVRFVDDNGHRESAYVNLPNMSVHEITSDLQSSYDAIASGLEILKQLNDDLLRSKESLHYGPEAFRNSGLADVDRLLRETEHLRAALTRAAERKKHYLEDLLNLQATLHEDRKKMEEWTRISEDSQKTLQTKLTETSKITKEQQILIKKLKKDNQNLWRILQEIQNHLRAEKFSIAECLESRYFVPADNNTVSDESEGQPCILPTPNFQVPDYNHDHMFFKRYFDPSIADKNSEFIVERSDSDCSSEEAMLSHQLRNLLDQSKSIQGLIDRMGQSRREVDYGNLPKPPKHADASSSYTNSNAATSCRIPSEDERGVRSDMSDLMRRCQELEQRVKDCSATDVRERIVKEMDKLGDGPTKCTRCCSCNKDCSCPLRQESEGKRDYSQHRRVREELLRCLDKIANLERNFTDAQDEIIHLRNYIKATAEEKEFCEQTYKREALELRAAVEDKDKEIGKLRDLLSQLRTQLEEQESICDRRIRELEANLLERDEEIRVLKEERHERQLLQTKLDAKSKELDAQKDKLLTTIQDLERFRAQEVIQEELREQNQNLQVKIAALQGQNAALIARRDENITEELRSLQAAIEDTEKKIKREQLSSAAQMESFEKCKAQWLSEIEILNSRLEEKERQLSREKSANDLELKRLREDMRQLHSSYETQYLKKLQLRQQDGGDYTGKRINSLNKEKQSLEEIILQKDDIIAEQQQRLNDLLSMVESAERNGSELPHIPRFKDNQPSEEVSYMRSELGESKDELVDRLLDLDRKLNSLRDENTELRQITSKEGPEIINANLELQKQIVSLTKQRDILADTINKSYPGLVDGTIHRGEELQKLAEENHLLRSHVGLSRGQLVDKIHSLQTKIRDLHDKLAKQAARVSTSILPRSRSPVSLPRSPRTRSQSPRERNYVLSDALDIPSPRNYVSMDEVDFADKEEMYQQLCALQDDNDILKEERKTIRETLNKGTKNLINKYLQLVSKARELQDENQRLESALSNAGAMRDKDLDVLKELEELRNDRIEMRKIIESLGLGEFDIQYRKGHQKLVEEVSSLRDIIENYGESVPFGGYGKRLSDLENEIKQLKTSLSRSNSSNSPRRTATSAETRSTSPTRNPELLELQKKQKEMNADNVRLRGELEKTTGNLAKLAKILEKEKSSNSADKASKIKAEKLEEKLAKLDNEYEKLKSEMSNVMKRNQALENEVEALSQEASTLKESKTQIMQEAKKLRSLADQANVPRSEDGEVREKLNALKSTVEELRTRNSDLEKRLKIARDENKKLNKEGKQSQMQTSNMTDAKEKLRNVENERLQMQEHLSRLSAEADELRKKNRDLEEEKVRLEHVFDNMQNELSEKHFLKWLQNDADKRISQTSSEDVLEREADESQPGDDNSFKREHGKLIRRLQVENKNLKAKLSSLEDETVATTKIIADLERGHGHLTGTLRCHLVLQQGTTGKLLEGALHQYHSEYESLKRKFQSLEDTYDREKQFSKRRGYAWDLFKNASGTLNNIHTILNEGLIKAVDDIEKDLADEGFEARDYKSRLWILRRRLSDVENRHRELQLRAEELSIRLDAKTAEYEVTQDELEDITRDLEHRDVSLKDLKTEVLKITKENAELKELIRKLKEHQEKTIGSVMSTNESLRLKTEELTSTRDGHVKLLEEEANNLKKQIDDKNLKTRSMQKDLDNINQELLAKNSTLAKLEARLKEMTDERDQLRREAGYRAGYMPSMPDHHGTIHLLRDDIKKLSKENADLKQDLLVKTRQMYDMSKDLNRLRQETGEGSKRSPHKKSSAVTTAESQMLSEIAKLKVENAILAAKFSELGKAYQKLSGSELVDVETEAKLVEQEIRNMQAEIEHLRQENSEVSANLASLLGDKKVAPRPGDDSLHNEINRLSEENRLLMDVVNERSKSPGAGQKIAKEIRDFKKEIESLRNDNNLLNRVLEQKNLVKEAEYARLISTLETKVDQQQAELESLNTDLEAKRLRIRELLALVERLNKGGNERGTPAAHEMVGTIKRAELESMATMLDHKAKEANLWRDQAEYLQREIERVKASNTVLSAEDDRFRKLYLNIQQPHDSNSGTKSHMSVTPEGGAQSRTVSSAAGSPAGHIESPRVSRGVLIADIPDKIALVALGEDESEDSIHKPIIKAPLMDIKKGKSQYRGDVTISPSLPPKGSKIDYPSKIPISPIKKKHDKKSPSSEDAGERSPKSDNEDQSSMPLYSRESLLERQLQEQDDDIHTLLMSVDHFERENQRLKAQLESGKSSNGDMALKGLKKQVNDHAGNILGASNMLSSYNDSMYSTNDADKKIFSDSAFTVTINSRHAHDPKFSGQQLLERDAQKRECPDDCPTQDQPLPMFGLQWPSRRLCHEAEDFNSRDLSKENLQLMYDLREGENRTLKSLVEAFEETVKGLEQEVSAQGHDLAQKKNLFERVWEKLNATIEQLKIDIGIQRKTFNEKSEAWMHEKETLLQEIKELTSRLKKKELSIISDRENIHKQVNENINECFKFWKALLDASDARLTNCQRKFEVVEAKLNSDASLLCDTQSELGDIKIRLFSSQRELQEKCEELNSIKEEVEHLRGLEKQDRMLTSDLSSKFRQALDEKNKAITFAEENLRAYKVAHELQVRARDKEMNELKKQVRDYKILVEKTDTSSEQLKSELQGSCGKHSKNHNSLGVLRKSNLKKLLENQAIVLEMFQTSDSGTSAAESDEFEVERTQSESESLQLKMEYLEEMLEDKEAHVQQITLELENALLALEEHVIKVEKLQEEKNLLEEKLRAEKEWTAKLTQSTFALAKDLEAANFSLKEQVELKNQMSNRDQQISNLLTSFQEKEEDVSDLRRLNSELISRSEALHIGNEKLQQHSDLLNREAPTLPCRHLQAQNLEKTIDVTSSPSPDELNDRIKTLVKEIKLKDDELEEITKKMKEEQKSKEALLETKVTEIQNLSAWANEVNTMNTRLHNENGEKDKLIIDLQSKLQDSESKVQRDMLSSKAEAENRRLDSELQKKREELFASQTKSLFSMMEQISKLRNRNIEINSELGKSREELFAHKIDHIAQESKLELTETESRELRSQLLELRNIIEKESVVNGNEKQSVSFIRAKLFDADVELREKSKEISQLKIQLQVAKSELATRDLKIQKFALQPTNLELKSSYLNLAPPNEPINAVFIESFLQQLHTLDEHESALQNQISELRLRLLNKEKHCDLLQIELSEAVGKLKDVERRLIQEEGSAQERFVEVFDDACSSTDITNITTESASSSCALKTLDLALIKPNPSYEVLQDMHFQLKIENNQLRTECHIKQMDLEKLHEKMKLAQSDVLTLQKHIQELEAEQLCMQQYLREVNGKVWTLGSQQLSINLIDSLISEQLANKDAEIDALTSKLKDRKQEVISLKVQRSNQDRYYEARLSNLQESMGVAKDEHVKSLKADFDMLLTEKIELQVLCKEMEGKLELSDNEMKQIKFKNDKLETMLRSFTSSS